MIPRPEIGALLREHFVALAADADEPESEVHRLSFRLKNATLLPFVLLAGADGAFAGGRSGAIEPGDLQSLLEAALA